MKRAVTIFLLALFGLSAVSLADRTGVGVFGGGLYPVGQEDQETGTTFGAKVRFRLTGPIVMEPNANFGKFGAIDVAGVGSRDGSSVKHFGLDFLLGGAPAKIGPKPYLFIGGGVYTLKRDGDKTYNRSGWSFGVGMAVGIMEMLDIEIRGRCNIAAFEGSTSKKSVAVTGGVNYYFGSR